MRPVAAALRAAARRAGGWAAGGSAAVAAVIFLWLYASDVLAKYWHGPGAGQAPWRGFFDQSLYLASAQAFATLNLDPARHFYPPLYALLAAPFSWLFPADPFAFVNVACVAGSVAILVALFGGILGRLPAALAALAFLLLPGIMRRPSSSHGHPRPPRSSSSSGCGAWRASKRRGTPPLPSRSDSAPFSD